MSQRYIGGLIYNSPGGYSGYFDGSGDYLSVADATALNVSTGDFTLECWAFPTSSSTYQVVFAKGGVANTDVQGISLSISGGTFVGLCRGSGAQAAITSSAFALSTWNHLVLVRSGTTLALFVNGVRAGTQTNSNDASNTHIVSIGTAYDASLPFTGYISNARLVKGTAVYDPTQTSITVPNGPLQNITNTSLLTCRYPTFVDGSSNAFTITVNGNTTVSTQNPFPLTTLPNPAQGGAGNGIFSMSQYQSLKQQNLWPTVDPYFDYTTLLLHGNGTNGGQNNTFLDSSSNNFTITRNGNTTQGTFSPFSVGAGYWSNYFDGSSGYITAPGDTAFAFGTGDFTVEMWVNIAGTNAGLISHGPVATLGSWMLEIISGTFYWQAAITGNLITASASSVLGTGWKHVAVTRASGTTRLFADGLLLGSSSTASNFNTTTGPLSIGKSYNGTYANGYMSNVRIIKGTALYTAAFTPPTAPLTAISGTSLLTCQSNRFVDNGTANSGSGFTITAYGSSSVQAFSPFAPTAAYNASTVGGSGYFDGTGDYLNGPSTGQFAPTGNFTISMWFYPTSFAASYYVLAGSWNSGVSDEWLIQYDNTGAIRFLTTTDSTFSSAGVVKLNQWQFLSISRSGSTVTGYINGTSFRSYTLTGTVGSATKTVYVGIQAGTTWPYVGWISDFRLVAGSAESATNPTAPATAISGTNMLLNFTNAAIIDNTAKNVLETVGNAQISTSVSKFGGGSLYFDGTGDYLQNRLNDITNFGTGDFTMECWIYPTTSATLRSIVDTRGTDINAAYGWFLSASDKLDFLYKSSSPFRLTSTSSVSTNVWTHVVVCRASGTLRLFINGTVDGSATVTDSLNGVAGTRIGGGYADGSGNPGFYLTGYIDDLRITKGIARYTSNFTPQTSQWQDQ